MQISSCGRSATTNAPVVNEEGFELTYDGEVFLDAEIAVSVNPKLEPRISWYTDGVHMRYYNGKIFTISKLYVTGISIKLSYGRTPGSSCALYQGVQTYMNHLDFRYATGLFKDINLSIPANIGFYSFNGTEYREWDRRGLGHPTSCT